MSKHFHVVAWVDHHEARIIFFNADNVDETIVRARPQKHHIHSKAGSVSGTHLTGDMDFFRTIVDAISPAGEIYIVGPAAAKTELMEFIRRHASAVASRVMAVETLDKVSDAKLLSTARRFFFAVDRMRPQIKNSFNPS